MTSSAQPPALNTNPKELDIACPLCEYNLRGLSEPRCPECGYKFVWAELIDATRTAHPYLFEVQRRRNVWSFWKTLVGGLRPGRFWKALKPAHRGNLRRLFLYWLITLLIGFAAAAALDRVMRATIPMLLARYAATRFLGPGRSLFYSAYSSRWVRLGIGIYSKEFSVDRVAVIYVGAILIWPVATFLALLIFQQSMARAKIRTHHLLRCVIYSADVVIWASIFCMAVLAAYVALVFGGGQGFSTLEVYLYICIAIVVIFCIRLGVALHVYLQMDRPFWTVLATQVLVALAIFTALVVSSVT